MIQLRLFPLGIVFYACVGSLLMRGSLGQQPVLNIGSFTSSGNPQCIRSALDTLTLEGNVTMAGVDASEWVGNGVEFRSQQTLICTVNLIECPPSTPMGCYCTQFDDSAETYTVRMERPASASYNEQNITMRMVSSDFLESVTSGQALYPYVNVDVSESISYGSKTKSMDVDGTDLDIPEDNQLVEMTINSLRQPFTITYSTNLSPNSSEVENTDNIRIPLAISATSLTVSYKENSYCEREGNYSFTITSVQRQSPYLDIEAFNGPACPVDGLGDVSWVATVNATAANLADWDLTVFFRSEENQILCSAILNECPPSDVSTHVCYCQQRVGDVFTIIGNHEASSSLSRKEIHMEMSTSDRSITQRSGAVMYPYIDRDNVRIQMTYANDDGNRRYSSPVNNSVLDHPEDNPRLTFTVNGLQNPFTITYIKLNRPVRIDVTNNQNSATFSIEDDAEMIQLSYAESLNCRREANYIFTFKDSSDDLSTGAIVGIVFGAILFVVIVILFIIICLLVRAKDEDKGTHETFDNSIEERGHIIDYSSGDVEDTHNEDKGPSYDNNAYVVDVPANSSSVVMNPVFDENSKGNEYTSLDGATQNEPGPSYESLSNGKPTGASPDEEPKNAQSTEEGSGNENVDGIESSTRGPYVSIISTSL